MSAKGQIARLEVPLETTQRTIDTMKQQLGMLHSEQVTTAGVNESVLRQQHSLEAQVREFILRAKKPNTQMPQQQRHHSTEARRGMEGSTMSKSPRFGGSLSARQRSSRGGGGGPLPVDAGSSSSYVPPAYQPRRASVNSLDKFF